jgi:hypothetical protein
MPQNRPKTHYASHAPRRPKTTGGAPPSSPWPGSDPGLAPPGQRWRGFDAFVTRCGETRALGFDSARNSYDRPRFARISPRNTRTHAKHLVFAAKHAIRATGARRRKSTKSTAPHERFSREADLRTYVEPPHPWILVGHVVADPGAARRTAGGDGVPTGRSPRRSAVLGPVLALRTPRPTGIHGRGPGRLEAQSSKSSAKKP